MSFGEEWPSMPFSHYLLRYYTIRPISKYDAMAGVGDSIKIAFYRKK
jgi:hypothetical protein